MTAREKASLRLQCLDLARTTQQAGDRKEDPDKVLLIAKKFWGWVSEKGGTK